MVSETIEGFEHNDCDSLLAKASAAALALAPAYHLYDVGEERVDGVREGAKKRDLAVCIVMHVEDARKQHPLMPVADVAVDAVAELALRHADGRILLAGLSDVQAGAFAGEEFDHVCVEMSGFESLDPIAAAVDAVGRDRVLLGSRAPIFVSNSSVLKVETSGVDEETKRRVLSGNAARFFGLD